MLMAGETEMFLFLQIFSQLLDNLTYGDFFV